MTAYTEAEAKTKWCPYVRLIAGMYDARDIKRRTNGFSPAHNRRITANDVDVEIPNAACCIASGCMAWRWANGIENGETVPAYKRTRIREAADHWDNEPMGFCGLAGKPE